MGVINLSVLVDKIKRKLVSGGFITSSDKASKSKFGIVKIGDGINVSSGTISVAAQGGTVSLYHYTSGDQNVNTDIAFTTPMPEGTKTVLFLGQGTSYPWITGFGFVDPNLTIPDAATGWTTQMTGYTGAPTVLLARDKTKFQRTSGSADIIVDVIAVL